MKMRRKIGVGKWVLVLIILFSVASSAVDYSRIKNNKDLNLAIKYYTNDTVYYIGLLYYYSGNIMDSPTRPLFHSTDIKIGVWFLPGLSFKP